MVQLAQRKDSTSPDSSRQLHLKFNCSTIRNGIRVNTTNKVTVDAPAAELLAFNKLPLLSSFKEYLEDEKVPSNQRIALDKADALIKLIIWHRVEQLRGEPTESLQDILYDRCDTDQAISRAFTPLGTSFVLSFAGIVASVAAIPAYFAYNSPEAIKKVLGFAISAPIAVVAAVLGVIGLGFGVDGAIDSIKQKIPKYRNQSIEKLKKEVSDLIEDFISSPELNSLREFVENTAQKIAKEISE